MKQTFVKVLTEEIDSAVEFVLKNNYFEFDEKVCRKISGTSIGTKFTLAHACILMDEMETSFLKTQQLQSFIWYRYIEKRHQLFLKDLN